VWRITIERVELYLLALDIAPLTGEIIKKSPTIFERGESLLQNGMLHFVFWIGQLSENRTSKLEFTETKNRLF